MLVSDNIFMASLTWQPLLHTDAVLENESGSTGAVERPHSVETNLIQAEAGEHHVATFIYI